MFKKISSIDINTLKDQKRYNNNDIEGKKAEFGSEGLTGVLYEPVRMMGELDGKNLFSKFMDPQNIITLASYDDFYGYYPFHSSKSGGVLGAHVDHSNLDRNYHFANSLLYVHPEWKKNWGGETILFSGNGLIPKKLVLPKPNRLVLFIHSNSSFHGVKKIRCPKGINRNSYYMDYYIHPKNVKTLNVAAKGLGYQKKLKFSYHPTTFIPFFPYGLKSIRLTMFAKLKNYGYIYGILMYLLFRIPLLTKLRFKLFNQIRALRNIFKKINPNFDCRILIKLLFTAQ